MSSRDVRDILELGAAPSPSTSLRPAPSSRPSGPPGPPAKRIGGIARELFALIGDNAPPLALATPTKPKFKERIKRDKPTVHWQLVSFTNPSRGAGQPAAEGADAAHEARKKLVLKHWVKDLPTSYAEGTPDHKFAKFNTSSQPFSYTADEYDRWLKVDGWSKEETDHLFQLAHAYDLRFIVMTDRWSLSPERGVDALKDRYYWCCRTLAQNRPGPTPADAAEKEKLDRARQETIANFNFDMNRELERKAYLRSLLDRTPAQVAEEDFLYLESRRIEQNYNRIASERADLLHLLGGREGVGVASSGVQLGVGGGAKGAVGSSKDMQNRRKSGPGWDYVGSPNALPEGWAGEGSKRKATAAEDAALGVERHPAPTVAAPKASMWPSIAVRSSRLAPVKSGIAQKVSAALAETGISTQLIMPTKTNLAKLEDLQGALAQMIEVKKALDRIQGEIRLVRKKRAALRGEEDPVIKGEDDDDKAGVNRNKRSASVASHQASGFSAAVIIDPQGPPTAPMVEHRPLALGPTETATWIEGTPGVQVRVFFTREHQFKPVVGLEAYAAYVLVDEGTPWVKIYAIGEGVQLPPNHTQPWPWFLDADLGGAAADLQETLGKKVSLKIYRCELLPGVELGYGQLYSKDVAKIDREHPVCIMNWHYASRQQLDMLGLLNGPSQADSFVPPSPLTSSLAFLRHASRILLDLATPEQRVAFIERLSTSSEVLQLLPETAQRELTADPQLYVASRPLDPFAQSHNVETGALDARFSASLAPGTSWIFAWGDHRPVKTPALATVVVQEGQEQPACWHVAADDVPNVRGVLSASPLKVALVLRDKSSPFYNSDSTDAVLAVFNLVVLADSTPPAWSPSPSAVPMQTSPSFTSLPSSPSASNSTGVLLSPFTQASSRTIYSESPRQPHETPASTSHASQGQFQALRESIAELEALLTPASQVVRLSRRLQSDVLSPAERVHLALERQRVIPALEDEAGDMVGDELQGLLAALIGFEKGGA
ncbi:Swc4p [Rhodotorula paludigena]|uniref:Swc4p n=1 Tax=Rhodotorula paludigena TaxID=86838 RepID=UPI003180B2F3